MRKFKVHKIESDNESDNKIFMGQFISLIPILSDHYNLLDIQFRCIEHKMGMMKLKHNDILLELKEIF